MIKKIRRIYIGTLVVALPVSLYMFVYTTSFGSYSKVEGTIESRPLATILAVATSKPVSLVNSTPKSVIKKPVVKKKASIKKKVVKKKKKVKRKEKLTIAPPLFTPQTAPHTAR